MKKSNLRKTPMLPLDVKDRAKTELPALLALSAIGEPWFSAQHQSDLLAVALVVRELAPAESAQGTSAAELQRLCEQPIGIENKVDIALSLAECLPWLQLQQNAQVDRAIQAVASRH